MKIKHRSIPEEKSESNIVKRNVTTDAMQFALYAFYDYTLRSQAQIRLDQLFDAFFFPNPPNKTELFRTLYKFQEMDLHILKSYSSPIAKVLTPALADVWPEQIAIAKNIVVADPNQFKKHLMDKAHLTHTKLNQIKLGGLTLGGVSLALVAHSVVTSPAPANELSHQTALLSGGISAGITAARLAVGPCALAGPYAPVCVAAVALTAGVLGTEASEAFWQFSKNIRADSVLFKMPVKSGQTQACEGPSKESIITVSQQPNRETESNQAISNLLAAMNSCNSSRHDSFHGDILSSCIANMNTLQTSQREFSSNIASDLRAVNLSSFSQAAPVDITYSDVVHYQTAMANRFYLSSRPHMARPSHSYSNDIHSFFSGNDGGGYDGQRYTCDSRFQDCSNYGGNNDCHDSDSGKCKSTLF